jgi:preprotein translocase subunit SecA
MYVASPGTDADNLISSHCRYCYLLEDLTPELLAEKCPNYDSLGDFLRMRGREAYLEKKVVPGLLRLTIF